MPRLKPVDLTNATAETQALLRGVHKKLGMLPNMLATMAQSHVVAQAYLGFSQSLSNGVIPARLREQIALTVAEANECRYCLAAHSAVGSSIGLTEDEIRDARTAVSPDRKTEVVLQFARTMLDQRGAVSDDEIAAIRDAGYSDVEIVEIAAHVALNIFANYLNRMAQTEVDFPPVAQVVPA